MDASLQDRAERLAREMASQAETTNDVNSLMRLMMKSALERMLDTEMENSRCMCTTSILIPTIKVAAGC